MFCHILAFLPGYLEKYWSVSNITDKTDRRPHLSTSIQVSFVTNDQHWKFVPIFDSEHLDIIMLCVDVMAFKESNDLFVELVHFVERSPISKREYQEEALTRPHVLLPHGAELLLAGRVEDVQLGHGVIDYALLGVGVFNGGIIVSHEVAL